MSEESDLFETLERNLRRRGYRVERFQDPAHLAARLKEVVRGKMVGRGSSMTLDALGFEDEIAPSADRVYTHRPGGAGESERNALTADLYLTSANAVSLDGQIVNIDGTGNRVAATCFGPHEVIFVVGRNKIVPSLEDALTRTKQTAVKLAAHYRRKTPCVKTGRCTDCLSDDCVCSITTIHRKNPIGGTHSVFLVAEDMGL